MILQRLAKYDFHEMTFARWFMQKTDNRALSSKYCRTLSYARYCIYCTRKTMGVTGRGQCELEVTHRKVFTFTLASFSRVQNAQYEPESNCVMKILNSTIEFQVPRENSQVSTIAMYNTMGNLEVKVSNGICKLLRRHCLRRRRNLPRGFIIV